MFPDAGPPRTEGKMGNAFVTGGTGFLGSYFLAGLARSYRQIWALVRGANPTVARQRLARRIEAINGLAMERVGVVLGDIEHEAAGLSDADVGCDVRSGCA